MARLCLGLFDFASIGVTYLPYLGVVTVSSLTHNSPSPKTNCQHLPAKQMMFPQAQDRPGSLSPAYLASLRQQNQTSVRDSLPLPTLPLSAVTTSSGLSISDQLLLERYRASVGEDAALARELATARASRIMQAQAHAQAERELLQLRQFQLQRQQMHLFPSSPTRTTMMMGPAPISAVATNQSIGSPAKGLDLLRTVSLAIPQSQTNQGSALTSREASSVAGRLIKSPKPTISGALGKEKMRQFPASSISAPPLFSEASTPVASPTKSPARIYVNEILDWDVLCGRGGRSNHHPGNKRYRQVVSDMKAMYRTTEAKNLKTDLSRAIVEHVCNYGGRFIKKDDAGRYYVLTKAEARKKTSQALRETKELKWTL